MKLEVSVFLNVIIIFKQQQKYVKIIMKHLMMDVFFVNIHVQYFVLIVNLVSVLNVMRKKDGIYKKMVHVNHYVVIYN